MNTDTQAINVLPRDIIRSDTFRFRQTAPNEAHIKELARVIQNNDALDPILLWKEHDGEKATGRLILLDGEHRLRAYATARVKGPRKWDNQGVPARVIECSLVEARYEAVNANTKDSLPLTMPERLDAAWALVRVRGKVNLSRVSRVTTVSRRTVTYMAKRYRWFKGEGKEPTGQWARDKVDQPEPVEPMTDAARNQARDELIQNLKPILGPYLKRDLELIGEALVDAMGLNRFRDVAHTMLYDEFNEDSSDAIDDAPF